MAQRRIDRGKRNSPQATWSDLLIVIPALGLCCGLPVLAIVVGSAGLFTIVTSSIFIGVIAGLATAAVGYPLVRWLRRRRGQSCSVPEETLAGSAATRASTRRSRRRERARARTPAGRF